MDDPSLEKAFKDFKWLKDRGTIKNTFFAYHKLHHALILKSNGEYFLAGAHFKTKYYKKFINNKDWYEYKRDHKETLNGKYPKGKGVFKHHLDRYHLKACF
ncbi:hypothetical protein [Mesonia sp.]|uniref:hypothetical protein n=1 Tax=Mesonia sp. TaxID=1960830 RepID=UPI003F9863BA